MKIAYILPKLSKSAPITYTHTLVKFLIKFAEIDVFYFDDVVELDFPCNVQRVSFNTAIDFDKYDIVHGHGYRPDNYIYKFRTLIRGQKISTIHSYIRTDLQSTYNIFISAVYSRIWLKYLSKMDYVVTLTRNMRTYYSPDVDADKLIPIYTGHTLPLEPEPVDKEDLPLIEQLKTGRTLIGVLANLTKQKGVDQIIRAIAEDQAYGLLIIGEGKQRLNLEKLAKRKGCLDRCLFLGHKRDAFRYLKYIDIYAMSSYQEGFGLVTLEAAQFKKPLICSDIPVFREIFSENTVAYFKKNNPSSFLEGLKKLMQDYDGFGTAIFNLYTEKYTAEMMAENYFDFYQRIVKTGNNKNPLVNII